MEMNSIQDNKKRVGIPLLIVVFFVGILLLFPAGDKAGSVATSGCFVLTGGDTIYLWHATSHMALVSNLLALPPHPEYKKVTHLDDWVSYLYMTTCSEQLPYCSCKPQTPVKYNKSKIMLWFYPYKVISLVNVTMLCVSCIVLIKVDYRRWSELTSSLQITIGNLKKNM